MSKKILLLLSLVFTALFISCTGAKDSPKVPEKPFDIVGTKWEATYRITANNPSSALVSVVYDFSSPTEVTFKYAIKEGIVAEEDMGLLNPTKFFYTYAASTLKILSYDGTIKTVYKVDEKSGTMFVTGKETLDSNGKWIPGKDEDDIILRLKK